MLKIYKNKQKNVNLLIIIQNITKILQKYYKIITKLLTFLQKYNILN